LRAWLSILAFCVGVIFLGVWRGEDISVGPFDYIIDLAMGLVWFVASTSVAWRNKRIRAKVALVGIAVPVALIVGLYVGQRESTQAFNECVQKGEPVRAALGAYYSEKGRYPEGLTSLQMEDLPGDRLLRGNILQYTSAGEGYELFFGDWLVSHTATESSPFTAQK
jgi:hypothetical protein